MDEIDWLKKNINVFILITKIFWGIAIFFIILALIGCSKNECEYTMGILFIALIIGIGFPAILGLCYLVIYLITKILSSGETAISFNKEYIRDLPQHCSPALASYIYDLKIDVYKDYTATILYLCIKKYINLIKTDSSYRLEIVKEKDFSNLKNCEKYVLNIITGKCCFDENQFKKEVIKDAQESGLITDKTHSNIPKILLISIVAIILLIITYNLNKILFMFFIIILGTALFTIVFLDPYIDFKVKNTKYVRTKDGKSIALLLKGLKQYFSEYTLIKDKDIEYMQVLDNYIPYALALDEADAVESFIINNEEYRDLIYTRNQR